MDNIELWYRSQRKGGIEYSADNIYTLSFNGDGSALKAWTIFGSAGGVGERTTNLAPVMSEWVDGYLTGTSAIAAPDANIHEKTSPYISVTPGGTLNFFHSSGAFPGTSDGNTNTAGWRAICFYNSNYAKCADRVSGHLTESLQVEIPQNCAYVRISFRTFGNSEPVYFGINSQYEPYGYYIPVKCGSPPYKDENGRWQFPPQTRIYIGNNQLFDGDSFSSNDTEAVLLTAEGRNVFEVNTSVIPSKIHIISSCGMNDKLCDYLRYRFDLAGGSGYE